MLNSQVREQFKSQLSLNPSSVEFILSGPKSLDDKEVHEYYTITSESKEDTLTVHAAKAKVDGSNIDFKELHKSEVKDLKKGFLDLPSLF